MAVLKGGPVWERGPSLDGTARVYVDRGQLVLSKWPRRRGRNVSDKTREQMAWFTEADIMAKNASASDWRRAIEMSSKSAFFPRDLLFSAMRGRLYWTQTEDGRLIIPVAAQQDLTFALDMLGHQVGSVLVRHGQLWLAIPPGAPGQALIANGPGEVPQWKDVGGGGANLVPPTKADFPTLDNPDSLIVENSDFAALALAKPAPGFGDQMSTAAQAVPAGDRTLTMMAGMMFKARSGESAGLTLLDSTTGRRLRWHVRSDGSFGARTVIAETWADPTTAETTIEQVDQNLQTDIWLRAVRQQSTWTLQLSASGAAWLDVASFDEAAENIAVDLAGPSIVSTDNITLTDGMAVRHWTNLAS